MRVFRYSLSMPALRLAATLALVLALPALADEPPEQTTAVVSDIRDRLIQVVPIGFGGIDLQQKGQPLKLGFVGGNVDTIFHDFPDALASARAYRAKSIAGHTLGAIGALALIVDLGLGIAWGMQVNGQAVVEANRGVLIGLAVGGGVVGIAGAFLVAAAQGHLLDAVNQYNTGVLNRHLSPDKEKRLGVGLILDSRQQGLALSYRF